MEVRIHHNVGRARKFDVAKPPQYESGRETGVALSSISNAAQCEIGVVVMRH